MQSRMVGWGAVACSVLVVACGANDGASETTDVEGITESDRNAAEAEVGRLQQRLGEPTCGATPADVNNASGASGTHLSPDAAYDHPTCRDAFVVDAPGLKAGGRIDGTAYIQGPTVEPIGCFFDVAFLYLYEKQGANYVLINQAGRFGQYLNDRGGPRCGGVMTFPIVRNGDYKVVASSVRLFTTVKNRVGVSIVSGT